MQLVRYSPSKDLVGLERDLDKIFRNSRDWDRPLPTMLQDLTTIDMYTENGSLVVETTLPGFKKEEIKLHVNSDAIDITAEHEEKREKKATREYLLHESSRSYRRQVTLPYGAKADGAKAKFANGTLTVRMPVTKQIAAKEVTIK